MWITRVGPHLPDDQSPLFKADSRTELPTDHRYLRDYQRKNGAHWSKRLRWSAARCSSSVRLSVGMIVQDGAARTTGRTSGLRTVNRF